MDRKCNVRAALAEDIQSIYDVHTSAIQELCSTHYSQEEVKQWAGRQNLTKYQSIIDKEGMAVGVLSNKIVGFGNTERYTDDTVEICGLFVSPQHSRQGIGNTILQYLEEKAKTEGYRNSRVKSSLNAQPFYEAMGYKAVGGDKCCHSVGDSFSLSCVLMCKNL